VSRFWIDIDNLPHVTVFHPVIAELEARGHTVELTVRDVAFSVERLADLGLPATVIGRSFGRAGWRKVLGTLGRAARLRAWLAGRGIALGLSHGSRSAVLAAAWAGVPCVTMYDYEHVSTGLQERFADRILVPGALLDHGVFAGRPRYEGYPGFKEQIYLGGFRPDPGFRASLEVPETGILVVLRPPAREAHYHNPRAEAVFQAVVRRLRAQPVHTRVLPRNPAELAELLPLETGYFRLLRRPVDGLQLVAAADLVISGGGTMNREAALLGTPVYSIFQGKRALLDEELARTFPFEFIGEPAQVEAIPLVPRRAAPPSGDTALLHDLCSRFEGWAAGGALRRMERSPG
jgi:predicted glycosyltransferase